MRAYKDGKLSGGRSLAIELIVLIQRTRWTVVRCLSLEKWLVESLTMNERGADLLL